MYIHIYAYVCVGIQTYITHPFANAPSRPTARLAESGAYRSIYLYVYVYVYIYRVNPIIYKDRERDLCRYRLISICI